MLSAASSTDGNFEIKADCAIDGNKIRAVVSAKAKKAFSNKLILHVAIVEDDMHFSYKPGEPGRDNGERDFDAVLRYMLPNGGNNGKGGAGSTMPTPLAAGQVTDIDVSVPFHPNNSEKATAKKIRAKYCRAIVFVQEYNSKKVLAATDFKLSDQIGGAMPSGSGSSTVGESSKPTADFSFSISGKNVTFTNASVGASSYTWDFGDGNSSEEESPEHIYSNAGTYKVKLTATNSAGNDVKEKSVIVNDVVISNDVIKIFNRTTEVSGATINVSEQLNGSDEQEIIAPKLTVKNTSDVDLKIEVTQYINSVPNGTLATFCWSACWGPRSDPEFTDTYGYTVKAGETHDLEPEYYPHNNSGLGVVKYKVWTKEDEDVYTDVTINYDMLPTSIETDESKTFSIYPNPVNNVLNINTTGVGNVKIYNSIGQLMISQDLTGGNTQINTSEFNNGMYYYEITINNEQKFGKLLKK
jgi:PKD repeat protein